MTYTAPIRSRRSAAVVAMAVVLALLPLAGPASAESFIDPTDPCNVPAPPADFDDRDKVLDVHQLTVDCAAALEISIGKPSKGKLLFLPAAATRRDWMASFIVRTLEAAGYDLPAPSDQGFNDVEGNTHEDNINILADIGVTKGTTDTTFAPGELVRRDQMVSFLVRAAVYAFEGEGGPGFVAQEPFPFDDVDDDNVHRDNIAVAAEVLGLTEGITESTFGPRKDTRRDQMATFLVRLVDIIDTTPPPA